MRSTKIYLEDIIEAMEKIGDFTVGMTYEAFCNDEKTMSAVRDKLTIIGEASKKIPSNIREAHPEIPWKEMTGMRDILTHAYFRTDPEMLYGTARTLPKQKKLIKKILENL